MKTTLSIAVLAAGLSVLAGNSFAEEVAAKNADRPTIRDERPEKVRGWVVVSKNSYWPLCYEALDNLTEVRGLAASADKQAIAASLEKCSAWLQLAASAAMVNEGSRILTIADRMDEVSLSLEENEAGPTAREIEVLATMGELAVAKSHLIRATQDYLQRKTPTYRPDKTAGSADLAAEEKEIRKARIQRDLDQYRYDEGQAFRHLSVAQTYLRAVAEQGEIELGELADESMAPLTGTESASELVTKDMELNSLANKLMNFIDQQQVRLAAQYKWEPKVAEPTEN